MNKVLIIVPAYNEEGCIVKVIDALKSFNAAWDIAVINDGSKDRTAEYAEADGRALVINLPCNLGIGGAVQTGFKLAKHHNYDFAVQFDGDGQHKANEIPKLLKLLEDNQADAVIGSRFIEELGGFKSTRSRRIGILVFSIVNSTIIKQRITDNTSGFRGYNKKTIRFLADNYPTDYPEPEAVVLLGRNGFRIAEISTIMQERTTGTSSISPIKAVYYMVKVLLGIFMTAVRPVIKK